jgi:hypothetical protein
LICCIHHVDRNAIALQSMIKQLIPHKASLGFASLFLVRIFLYVIAIKLFLKYSRMRQSRA